MNLIKFLRSTFAKAKSSLTFMSTWARVAWMDIAFPSLVKNGYKASSAVFACVRALSMSFSEPRIQVLREVDGEDQADPKHPIRLLLKRPNPDMGEAEFMAFAVTYASIGGNCYVWKERNASGRVVALWPFHDGNFEPVPGDSTLEGIVKEYKFDPGDGRKITISKKDVIQWKFMPDPEQPSRGMGAIQAAAKDTDSDVESSRYVYALLKNDAIPRVAVTLMKGDDSLLDPDKVERLRASWNEKYSSENRGGVAFLDAGMTIQRLGLNMQELAVETLKNIPESRICAAFGVPPVIAGLFVGLKRSDYGDGQARKSFTETTLAALWRSFASELQNGLVGEFGPDEGVTLAFALDEVRALQENINELWTRINLSTQNGIITRAEARRALGYKAADYDEVYRESLSATWVKPGEEAPPPAPVIPAAQGDQPEEDEQEGEEPPADEGKAVKGREIKGLVYGRSLQRIRRMTASKMAEAMDDYFRRLADRVVSRAAKALEVPVTAGSNGSVKTLPPVDQLLTATDERELTGLLRRWYAAIAEASWETINLSLGVAVAFDLTDPAVTSVLMDAGGQVKLITDTTRQALAEALAYGNEQGWSVAQLVRGDADHPGIRSIVEETYKRRAETIARTELGNAQNAVAANRYAAAGVTEVDVLDNGSDDDDEPCKLLNGTRQTLAWSRENPLEHPNCTRAFIPVIVD